MTSNNTRAEKARGLRYKKAILSSLNRDSILEDFYEIEQQCSDVQYFFEEDGETLLNALNGDEEQEWEFKMMFSDLSAKCEQFRSAVYDNYVTEHFDDFFVGICGNRYKCLGYDSYEEDYYSLTSYACDWARDESRKRLMRLTKEELLNIAGQCFGIAMSWNDIQHRYNCLQAAFDILKDENTVLLQYIKDIEAAYDSDMSENDFKRFVSELPDRFWIE